MADVEETQLSTPVETSPAPADNDVPERGGVGPDESSPESPPVQHDALWTRLGYASQEDLERTHTRYREQVSGSQREAQRLQQEVAERDRRLQEYERRMFQAAPPAQAPPADLSAAQAFEAYLNNDQQALALYEQQQQQRAMRLAQDQVLATLGAAVKPAQYSDAVLSKFPDLNDPKSAMYREVWERYDQRAADPYYSMALASDPGALRDAWSPDGALQKRVDMRIVRDLAFEVAADLARQEGRKQETQRRATAGAAGGPGAPPPQAAQEGPLLYEDEVINDPRVRSSMAALGKGSDPRTLRNWYWKNMGEREKNRRRALHQSGQWTGRRSA
jgi:hypothetical protein